MNFSFHIRSKHKFFFIGFFWLFSLLFSSTMNGQGNSVFYASTDSKTVVEGTNFNVEFVMNNIQGSNFTAPIFNNFDVVSGPNTMQSRRNVNGQVSQQIKLSYTLRAQKPGIFTLGAATCEFKGEKLATNTFEITVKARDKKSLEELGLPSDEDIFVRMESSKDTAYLGEKIDIKYKLYTNKTIRSYDFRSEADFAGFFMKNQPKRNKTSSQEEFNGAIYTTQVIESRLLYPQQTGVFKIDPAQIILGIPDGKQSNSFFFRPSVKEFATSTNSLEIHILDLPSNAPINFSGGVGNYQIGAEINKRKLSTDDAITMTLTVAGNGDPKYLLPPSQGHLTNFDIYEPKTINEGTRESFGEIQTIKTFEYLLVPLKSGKQRFSAEFTYFDSSKGKYMTLRANPFTIEVSQGQNVNNIELSESENGNRSLKGLMTSTHMTRAGTGLNRKLIYGSILLSCFVFLGFIFNKKRLIDIEAGIDPLLKKRNKAKSIAEKRLATASQHLKTDDSRSFYDEISKSLLGFIADKLNVPNSEISKINVATKLTNNGVDSEVVERVMAIISKCEMAIFAGKKEGGMKETYDETGEIIIHLSEKI